MKVVLISADGAVPPALRAIVVRGSTALVEHLAHELSGSRMPEADRLVFWGTGEGEEDTIQPLLERYVREAGSDQRQRILLVRPDAHRGGTHPPIAPDQLFAWPHDEDRLQVFFLTGA